MDRAAKEIRDSGVLPDHTEMVDMRTSQKNYEACRRMLHIVSELDQKMMSKLM